MQYTPEDYEALYGEKCAQEANRAGWAAVAFLILLIVGNLALAGCDGEAAEITAQIEKDAHERHQTVEAWWYSYTYAPIKASAANVTITVCQNTDSTTRWSCYAGNP